MRASWLGVWPRLWALTPSMPEFSPFGLRLAQETLQRWEHRNLLWKEMLVNTKRAGVFVYSQDLFCNRATFCKLLTKD